MQFTQILDINLSKHFISTYIRHLLGIWTPFVKISVLVLKNIFEKN